jgi:type II secretory pathway component GspD/PulD (secretin)
MSIQQMNMLGTQLRLPGFVSAPAGVGLQNIMLEGTDAIFNDPSNPSVAVGTGSGPQFSSQTTINSDLLSSITNKDSNIASTIADNRKGLIISLGEQYKNQGIAAILQIQNILNIRNVVQQPYIVTQNNRKTEIKDVNVRRAEGGLSANSSQYGGATIVNIEPYPTQLSISITPRINNIQEYANQEQPQLSLEMELSIDAWKIANDPNNLDKITRVIRTSANVGSGDLLILGGLYGQTTEKRTSKTPILGDIPILGALFRSTQVDTVDSNLVIIIRATAAEPRKDTLNRYTSYHADIAEELIGKEVLFSGHKEAAMRFSLNPEIKNLPVQKIKMESQQNVSTHLRNESNKEIFTEDDRYKKIKESLKDFSPGKI